jgi:hypothetical protein
MVRRRSTVRFRKGAPGCGDVFSAAGGRQPQQWHLVNIQDLVLERVSCPLVWAVLVEGEAVDFDGQ